MVERLVQGEHGGHRGLAPLPENVEQHAPVSREQELFFPRVEALDLGQHLVSERHTVYGQPHVLSEASAHGHSLDRKSTRLNSSHANISYAVFCLKKKKNK